jgi:transposase-like protein
MMGWKKVLPMEEKERFVILASSDRYTITELCEQFGISRKTGHKWLSRYQSLGKAGLEDYSKAPKSVHNKTSEEVERLIVKEKRLHMTWDLKKLDGF